MGRKSTYDTKVAEEICARLTEGEPLRQICRDKGMPNWRTIYDWLEAQPDFAARFARARDIGFDAIAEDTVQIIDEPPAMTADGKVDPGHVQWMRARVDQRLKLLAKWSPKKYGEKQQIEHSGKIGLEALVAGDE